MATPVKNDKLFLNLFIVAFLVIGVLATVFVVKEYSQDNRSRAGWGWGVNPNDYVDPEDYEGIETDAERKAEEARRKAEEALARLESGDLGRGRGFGLGQDFNSDPESIEQACTDLVTKYKNELNNYEARKEEAKAKYEQAKTNALELLDTADEMGYDTSEARAMINDIDAKVIALESEVDSLVTKWRNKKIDCSNPETYAQVQEELRTDLSKVREDVAEIRAMIREVVETMRSQVDFNGPGNGGGNGDFGVGNGFDF